MLRVAIIDITGQALTPAAPLGRPMGGAQSCACYLAGALARHDGVEVVLCSRRPDRAVEQGVHCRELPELSARGLRALGADLVILNHFEQDPSALLEAGIPLILWYHTAPEFIHLQPQVFAPAVRASDRLTYVFVSHTQASGILRRLEGGARAEVIANGVSPAVLASAEDPLSLARAKQRDLAVYTSTPFRGLDRLVEASASPDLPAALRFAVHSSMAVYGGADEDRFAELYEAVRQRPNMVHPGSVPQQELAGALAAAGLFAYPSSYPETFCIAAAEALAAGCQVVTSDLGALPEVCGPFARLVPAHLPREQFVAEFVRQLAGAHAELAAMDEKALAGRIRAQSDHVRRHYDWNVLAGRWLALIRSLVAPSRARSLDTVPERLLAAAREGVAGTAVGAGEWPPFLAAFGQSILDGSLDQFFRWPIVQYTIAPIVSPYFQHLLQEMRGWPDQGWRKLAREVEFWSPLVLDEETGASPISLQHASHVERFRQWSGGVAPAELDVIFEFGGGFGGLSRTLRHGGFKGVHVIYDFALMNEIQRTFMARLGVSVVEPAEVAAGRLPAGQSAVLVSDLNELKAVLEALESRPRKALWATWSLSEAPIALRDRILGIIPFQWYMMTYQPSFGGLANGDYFEGVMAATEPLVAWRREAIAMPGNFYVFGQRRGGELRLSTPLDALPPARAAAFLGDHGLAGAAASKVLSAHPLHSEALGIMAKACSGRSGARPLLDIYGRLARSLVERKAG